MTPRNDPRSDPRLRIPVMPSGTEVASYATYLEAQSAVDYLSDHGFDLKSITIVGTDLHMVERVTGRLTTGKVALSGASSGALWGGFMGLMMSFASTNQGAAMWIAAGVGGGALAGIIMSVLLYMAAGGQRDFTSHSQVVASRYAVLASSSPSEAFELLQKTPGNQRRPAPKPVRERSGPTEYGSKPDEEPRFGVRLSDEAKTPTSQPADSGETSASQPADSKETSTDTDDALADTIESLSTSTKATSDNAATGAAPSETPSDEGKTNGEDKTGSTQQD